MFFFAHSVQYHTVTTRDLTSQTMTDKDRQRWSVFLFTLVRNIFCLWDKTLCTLNKPNEKRSLNIKKVQQVFFQSRLKVKLL